MFSVVIPCLDAERFLGQALDSVADQTLPALEVLVVDDGSTDRSVEIAQEHPVVSEILETPGHGPAGPGPARNVGLSRASGPWVAFLDADDWWDADHLQSLASVVEGTSSVAVLGAARHVPIGLDQAVSRSDPGPFTAPTAGLSHQAFLDLYLERRFLELSASAFRRDRLVELGGFREGAIEDLDVVLGALRDRQWAIDPRPTSNYRCGNEDSRSARRPSHPAPYTAKLLVLREHQAHYTIPRNAFRALARSTLSQVILHCSQADARRAHDLVLTDLAWRDRLILGLGVRFPTTFRRAHRVRSRLRRPPHAPRVVLAGEGTPPPR